MNEGLQRRSQSHAHNNNNNNNNSRMPRLATKETPKSGIVMMTEEHEGASESDR
jgi:hypothetical protein